MRLVVVQQDFHVGDIDGNVRRIRRAVEDSARWSPDLLVFPELTLTGYPPEDLLYRGGFIARCQSALEEVAGMAHGVDLLVGHPWPRGERLYNGASWLRGGQIIGQYAKQALPNYAVFDEKRYFEAGDRPLTVECAGVRVGVLICEDIWEIDPARRAAADGAQLIVAPNASPYHLTKRALREAALSERSAETGVPVVYANLIGGQDELVFDGRSFAVQPDGRVVGPTPAYEDGLYVFDWAPDGGFEPVGWRPDGPEHLLDVVWGTLVRGTRDYVRKNGFERVVLGLSGGIDSALTLAIAVDALGADAVRAVMMPSRHTSDLSVDLARDQAERMGVRHDVIAIEPGFEALLGSLAPVFEGRPADVAEENLQARIRGNLLMALSNKFGSLLLTTGNKSEIAVGYCTIYGDMCGGFAPIKDCPKSLVYELARHRNRGHEVIPVGVIDRPPTAELAPGQTDQDSLPPYEVLDEIIERYVERDESVDRIIAAGFERDTVLKVARLVRINEYKRRQSAPGVRITSRAFGRDRRYPITNLWQDPVAD